MSINFLDHIENIEDYRIPGMLTYPLDEVLLLSLAGLLCRAEDFDEIECFGLEQLSWLRRFLPYENGIPQAQTLRRIFAHLDASAVEAAFADWVTDLRGQLSGVVALDGKRLRGTKHDADGEGALHLVSAYAHEAGLILGQSAGGRGGDEIAAINEILDRLELAGTVITIDAIGTQTKIAAKIVKKKADYILALKGNQATLHKDVMDWFKDEELAQDAPHYQHVDVGHGRIETRDCRATSAAWLAQRHPEWAGMASICRISVTRENKKNGETSQETRYYISSLPPEAKRLNDCVRAHWSIENNLHWQLDVTFREDESRCRKDHAAHNLATIRRTAFNLLKADKTKLSLKIKRYKALLNQHYREKLIAA